MCGPAAVTSPARADDPRIAIKGYDPVAYFTEKAPARGLAEIDYVWDEHRFRFTSEEHRQMFRADPLRYAPQFENFCAMALTRGELDEADPENWLVNDGKLYIFGKPVGPGLFRQSMNENIEKANRNRSLIRR
jgi:hypothetical protein